MTKIVVTVGFLVAFASGLVVGFERRDAVKSPTSRPSGHGGWLAAELQLSPQQREQLNKIWSEMASRGGRERDDRRRQLYRERDEAIAAMIRPEDKARYESILKSHSEKMIALDREWRGSFETSVERTKEILTPEQRTKYEEILRRHSWDRGSRDRRHGDRERETGKRGEHHPTSRSA